MAGRIAVVLPNGAVPAAVRRRRPGLLERLKFWSRRAEASGRIVRDPPVLWGPKRFGCELPDEVRGSA
jgi:hypothetical protein